MTKTNEFIGRIVKQINDGLKAAEECADMVPGISYTLCGDIDLAYRRNDIPFKISIRYNSHQVQFTESVDYSEKEPVVVQLIDFPMAFVKTGFIRNLFIEEFQSL